MAEKTLEDINRKARDLYLKASDALQRKNYDYAISLLLNVLTLEPDFVQARRYLRLAQVKRGSSFLKKATAKAVMPLRFFLL